MNRIICNITLSALALLMALPLCSCEKELEIERDFDNGLVVFALAVPGQQFSVRVSRPFSVNTNPQFGYYQTGAFYDAQDSIYLAAIAITSADVSIIVNGTDSYTLTHNLQSPYDYKCNYMPTTGDRIEFTVKADGYATVYSTTTVEQPSEIKVVETSVLYDKEDFDYNTDPCMTGTTLSYNTDSVMELVLRLHDPGDGQRYHRLVVRAMSTIYESIGIERIPWYSVNDVFSSDDVIFIDSQLQKPYADWPARFSNVFDNHTFAGGDYTVTVRSRQRRGEDQKVWIELQTLSSDFYYFLKSYQIYRISTDDVYVTPVGIYSNVTNGYGVVGSVSRDTISVHY